MKNVSLPLWLQGAAKGEGEGTPLLGVDETKSGFDRGATYNTILFCLLTALLFADTNLMAPNLTEIAEDFGMTPQERDEKLGGGIALAFFLLGAPVALAIGWYADSLPRKGIFCTILFLGQVPALLTLWVTQFWQLFILRALTGIAIAGVMPLLYSMLGDTYCTGSRLQISALIALSMQLGTTGGQFLAGMVGPAYGWRLPFAMVAAPAIVLNIIAVFTLEEPARGSHEAALKSRFEADANEKEMYTYTERITPGKAAGIFLVRTNVLVFSQGVFGCLPWAVVVTFLNDYLHMDKGMSVQESTFVLTALNLGGCAGVLLGGFLGQVIYNRRPALVAILMGGTTSLGVIPLVWIVRLPTPTPAMWVVCCVAAVGGVVVNVTGPCVRAVLVNVNHPETRGTALAVFNLCDDLGRGFGPFLVAILILSQGREQAFSMTITFGWVLCGTGLASIACFLQDDEEAVQSRLKDGSGAPKLTLCQLTCCLR